MSRRFQSTETPLQPIIEFNTIFPNKWFLMYFRQCFGISIMPSLPYCSSGPQNYVLIEPIVCDFKNNYFLDFLF